VRILEASHYDPAAAYVAVFATQDTHPYIYRTRDAGKSWQKIVAGLAEWGIARTVREDPVRRGLLYAGTENAIYVSFDDGDYWQSLQLNLPTTSVRDLAVHGNDLVACTYGRSLWILDNITPLRQASTEIAASEAHLFQPATVTRIRWDNDQETPLPPEFPAAKNPPDGAMIDYYLQAAPAGDISLEIRDALGRLVRKYSSAAPPPRNCAPRTRKQLSAGRNSTRRLSPPPMPCWRNTNSPPSRLPPSPRLRRAGQGTERRVHRQGSLGRSVSSRNSERSPPELHKRSTSKTWQSKMKCGSVCFCQRLRPSTSP
jgi:hypothetical protein